MSNKYIEFYDLKFRRKINVPAKDCYTEVLKTSRGDRKRIVGVIRDNPNDLAEERHLSKLCSMKFEL